MELAQDILDKLAGQNQLSSAEIQDFFGKIKESLQLCTKNELDLPQEFLLQKILAQALQTSSTRAVRLFQTALKKISLQRTQSFFQALRRQYPNDLDPAMSALAKVPSTGCRIVPVSCPSLAPDLLMQPQVRNTKQAIKPGDYVEQQRRSGAKVQFRTSEWEIKRKEALFVYLQRHDGIGLKRALVACDITQTVQNFFGFAQLQAEGRAYIKEVCKEEIRRLDGEFVPRENEQQRIFVAQLSRDFLQERKGRVTAFCLTAQKIAEWMSLYGEPNSGFVFQE